MTDMKLLLLQNNTLNHLIVFEKMSLTRLKMLSKNVFTNHIFDICK